MIKLWTVIRRAAPMLGVNLFLGLVVAIVLTTLLAICWNMIEWLLPILPAIIQWFRLTLIGEYGRGQSALLFFLLISLVLGIIGAVSLTVKEYRNKYGDRSNDTIT